MGLNSTGSSHLLALTVGTSLYCFCATSVVKPNFCPTRPWRKETRKEHLLRTTTGQHEITASFTMNATHSIHKCYHDMICMYAYLGVCACACMRRVWGILIFKLVRRVRQSFAVCVWESSSALYTKLLFTCSILPLGTPQQQ